MLDTPVDTYVYCTANPLLCNHWSRVVLQAELQDRSDKASPPPAYSRFHNMQLGPLTEFKHPDSLPCAVQIAAQDLRRDLMRTTPRGSGNGRLFLAIDTAMPRECYRARIDGADLRLSGGDSLGLVYGLYRISEDLLGIPPLWFWIDFEPDRRVPVNLPDNWQVTADRPRFRYRGWFLNGEDMLAGWGGDPCAIMDRAALDAVLEALLRLRGNMIIPGTNLFPDEPTLTWCAERGLILAEHHHEPLGLNVLKWPDHIPFDYPANPERFTSLWEKTVQRKLVHGAPVVWTLGLRGRKDCPIWSEMPGMSDDPKACGRMLSAILRKQMEIVRRHDPNPAFVYNLWMEGAEVYHAGELDIPDEVIICWPDNNSGIMTDRGRMAGGHGIYFHPGMCGSLRSRYSEWMPFERSREAFNRCFETGATAYGLLNVENIRPYVVTIHTLMRWMDRGMDAVHTAPAEIFAALGVEAEAGLNWLDRQTRATRRLAEGEDRLFGDQGFVTIVCRVVDAILLPDKVPLERRLHPLAGQEADRLAKWEDEARAALVRLEDSAGLVASIAPVVEPAKRPCFDAVLAFQSRYRCLAARMLVRTIEAARLLGRDREAGIRRLEEALADADAQAAFLRRASLGRWLGFYDADIFCASRLPSRKIRLALEVLRGWRDLPNGYQPGASCTQWYWMVNSYQAGRNVDAQ